MRLRFLAPLLFAAGCTTVGPECVRPEVAVNPAGEVLGAVIGDDAANVVRSLESFRQSLKGS